MGLKRSHESEISKSPILAAWLFDMHLKSAPSSSRDELAISMIPHLPADFTLNPTQTKAVLESPALTIAAEHLLALTPAAAVDLPLELLIGALRRSGEGRETARKNFTLLVDRGLPTVSDASVVLPFIFTSHTVLEISSAILGAEAPSGHYALRLFEVLKTRPELSPLCLREFCTRGSGFAFLAALIDRVSPTLEVQSQLWGVVRDLHLYRPREDSQGSQLARLEAFIAQAVAAEDGNALQTAFDVDPAVSVASTAFLDSVWKLPEPQLGSAVLCFLAEKGDLLTGFECESFTENLIASLKALPRGIVSFSSQIQRIWKFLGSSNNWEILGYLLNKVQVKENETEIARQFVSEAVDLSPIGYLTVAEFFFRGPFAWSMPADRENDELANELISQLKHSPLRSRAAALRLLVAPPEDKKRLLERALKDPEAEALLRASPGEMRCAGLSSDVTMEIVTESSAVKAGSVKLSIEDIPELLKSTEEELGKDDRMRCLPLVFVEGSRALPTCEAKWREVVDPRKVLDALLSQQGRAVVFACTFLLEGPLRKTLGKKTTARVLEFLLSELSAPLLGRALVALAGAARDQPHMQTAEALLTVSTKLIYQGEFEMGYFCFYTALVNGRDRKAEKFPWWVSTRCEAVLRAWRDFMQASLASGSLTLWSRLTETIAASALPRQCVAFLLEIVPHLQGKQEKQLRSLLPLLMKKLGKRETRHLHAIADGRFKELIKSEISSFEGRNRFKGKV